MCLVDLNHATTPCKHRWYHMIQPCASGITLTTCPGKLALEGWEIRCDFCPFCAGWDLSNHEFMIIGGSSDRHGSVSSAASTSSDGHGDFARFRGVPIGVPLSRRPSLSTSVSGARRMSRASSTGSEISTPPYDGGPVSAAIERNQQMNARVSGYMEGLPSTPEVAYSGKKKRKKASVSVARIPEPAEEIVEEQMEDTSAGTGRRRSRIGSITGFARRHSRDLTGMFR
ncbi:hypothetical protein BT63DRAFT_111691 [Microthyrium microscopicum]|uniref:Uncharacterized protein n=1 Tax=Microthyrium microscopicum TaxID=703497 RepID=A0A6A6TUM2_9PEZI|nr:hypothetical protein BT63DRAFT_111691 [Microthyrium microscopicum]